MSKVRLIQFYAYTYNGNDFAFTARKNVRILWDVRDNDGNLIMKDQETLPELDAILATFAPIDIDEPKTGDIDGDPDTDGGPESKDEFTD